MKDQHPFRFGIICGCVATVLLYCVNKTVNIFESRDLDRSVGLMTIGILFFLASMLAGWRVGALDASHRRASARHSIGGMYVGIAVGVVMWLLIEELIFAHIRTGLYPYYNAPTMLGLDIIFWAILATIPTLLGIASGIGVRRLACLKRAA
jgi:H+/Cl- antiporter ClcA